MLNIKRLAAAVIIILACTSTIVAATVVTICGEQFTCYHATEKSSLHRVARALGVLPETVLTYNPWATDGVTKGQAVFIPADKASMTPTDATSYYARGTMAKYTLGTDENIYTVAQRFDASVEALIAANPNIAPECYVAATTVQVPCGTATPLTIERKLVTFTRYKLQNGDSYYMLAKKNGLSENDLLAANPGTEQLKKGKYFIIPVVTSSSVTATPATLSVYELRNYYGRRLDDLYEAAHPKTRAKSDGANIAIVLPFQLHKPQPPRQALLYTDFYKGFLIALDSIQRRGEKPRVNLTVLDTEHNLNVTDSLLASGTLDNMDVIVAPLEPKQLERIINFGNSHDIAVLNCFATKNDDHLNNANVFQANVPMAVMTASVAAWVKETAPDISVIYVTEGGVEDAEAFNMLRKKFDDLNIYNVSVPIGSVELSFDNLSLEMLPGSQYLVVPSNGSKSLLKRILPALSKAKKERFDCEIKLLGYPEYVTYLKDYQEDLQDVDTFMFSRFFNANGYRTRDIEFYYNKWFKGQMLASYPNMVLYGFDTAMYLVQALSNSGTLADHTTMERGIQTSFRFSHVGDDPAMGYINDAICIVHFTPAHTIETIVR